MRKQSQKKNYPKGTKGIIVGVNLNPGIVSVPDSSLNAKKGFASVRKTIPRLIARKITHKENKN